MTNNILGLNWLTIMQIYLFDGFYEHLQLESF